MLLVDAVSPLSVLRFERLNESSLLHRAGHEPADGMLGCSRWPPKPLRWPTGGQVLPVPSGWRKASNGGVAVVATASSGVPCAVMLLSVFIGKVFIIVFLRTAFSRGHDMDHSVRSRRQVVVQ